MYSPSRSHFFLVQTLILFYLAMENNTEHSKNIMQCVFFSTVTQLCSLENYFSLSCCSCSIIRNMFLVGNPQEVFSLVRGWEERASKVTGECDC